MDEKYTYGLWGAAAGAAALAVVGFTWGDWYTSEGARSTPKRRFKRQ